MSFVGLVYGIHLRKSLWDLTTAVVLIATLYMLVYDVRGTIADLVDLRETTLAVDRPQRAADLLAILRGRHLILAASLMFAIGLQMLSCRFERDLTDAERKNAATRLAKKEETAAAKMMELNSKSEVSAKKVAMKKARVQREAQQKRNLEKAEKKAEKKERKKVQETWNASRAR